MTKSELIDRLAERAGLPRSTAELVVHTVLREMSSVLLRGGRIELRGFGSFKVKQYAGYMGRNPRTGDPIAVEPKVLPLFRASKVLLGRLNRLAAGSGR